ncbi:hypothetical protein LCGC14_2059050, partial [marine sediment metagenome]
HLNFPMLVSLSGDWLKTTIADATNGHIESDSGHDIIFRDTNLAQLDHEIEEYDGSASGGTLIAWVRIPILDFDDNTVIYMYYGNPCITSSTQNVTGVWDEYYAAVWHLDESPVDQGTHDDSTSNPNTGTWNDSDSGGNTSASGRIDGADSLDGSDDHIDAGNDTSLQISGAFTVSAWVNPTDTSTRTDWGDPIISKEGTNGFQLGYSSDTRFGFMLNGGGASMTWGTTGKTPVWYYVVGVYDGTTAYIYVNGIEENSGADAYTANTAQDLQIGAFESTRELEATIDEVRLSSFRRSADWIKTEYYNQKASSTFFSVDPEEDSSATVVDLISFTATGQSSTVLLEWETAQEIDNLGFNLYRSSDPGGSYTKLSSSLIRGLISSISGQQYTYIDRDVTRDVLYYYMLEDVDLYGTRTMHGPVCVDWDGDGIADDDDEDADDDDSDDDNDDDPEVRIPTLRFEEVDFGPEGWTPSSSYASWVKLSSFRARQGDEGIALEWETSFEVDNFGFHVYRELDGRFYRITPDLVPGSVFKAGAGRELPAGQSYTYWDGLPGGTGGELYWLDCVDLNGGRASFGPIKPEIYGQPVSERQKVRFRSITRHQASRARALGKARELRVELNTERVQTQSSKATFRMIDPENPSDPRLQPNEEQWALAAQPGVKIYVKEDGWYRVGKPELVAAGLSPDVDPRYLQLYADGEEKSMMV